jgi:predicted TIM-barrel fold metal-dependent hydrolase
MTPPWNKDINRYIGKFKEIQKTFRTFDAHIHPTEIIFNLYSYREDPELKGLYALGKAKYRNPSLEDLLKENDGKTAVHSSKNYGRILPLMLRQVYSHTGPRVFGDYFDILSIDRALLLPVSPETGTVEEQMAASFEMFKDDDRFRLAGSVPNTVRNEYVASYLKGQIDDYGIVAVKVHPNVTGIDLATLAGKERVECILAAGGSLHLPVIIHGGRSEILGDTKGRFADMANFRDIDFKTSSNVIIAHGGAYGMSDAEIADRVVPSLKKLLSAYGNLLIDLAGLRESAIVSLLSNVDSDRVLFGSDALYENEIAMGMRLLYALERTGAKSDDAPIRILSENAARTIFREESRRAIGV